MAGVFAAAAMVSGNSIAQVIYDSTPRYVQSASTGVVDSIERVRSDDRSRGDRVGGTILGGIVGGVIGHQFGSGRGNDAATVAGALGGAAVGHNLAEKRGSASADMYRVNVRMDDGSYRTVYQPDVYGLNIGDRVQLDNDRVFRYAGNDRYQPSPPPQSAPLYQPAPYRYSSDTYRNTPPEVYRSSETVTVYRDEPARYTRDGRIDRRVYRYDGQGYRVDQWGNRYDAEGYWVDERGNRHEYQDPPMENDPPGRLNHPQ